MGKVIGVSTETDFGIGLDDFFKNSEFARLGVELHRVSRNTSSATYSFSHSESETSESHGSDSGISEKSIQDPIGLKFNFLF